jgi:hypothetical protein
MSEKNYRVLFVPAIELSIHTYCEEFSELSAAKAALSSIARYTLRLHELNAMHDYSNWGSVEVFEDGEWSEIEEED